MNDALYIEDLSKTLRGEIPILSINVVQYNLKTINREPLLLFIHINIVYGNISLVQMYKCLKFQ